VELTLPRPARYLIEMTVIPTFVICSGSFGNGDHFVCPPDAWEWFFPIDYFARAVDLDTGEGLGCWHFRKVREARVDALSPAEVEAYGEELLSAAPLR